MTADPYDPEVVEGEVVDLDKLSAEEPRARAERTRTGELPHCACGKDGTPYSHGEKGEPGEPGYLPPFTCAEVLEIEDSIANPVPWWRSWRNRPGRGA